MENQPIVRLNFTCNRNWEDMKPIAGGRFCNDCQKKVVDFTDKTNDEIVAYLMNSTTQVCGNFRQSQLAPALPKPIWKRWLSAAAMFVAVFIGVKEASAQQLKDTTNKSNQADKYPAMGEVVVTPFFKPSFKNQTNSIQEQTAFGVVEVMPMFPGGENALAAYLHKNLRPLKGTQGRVVTVFVVEKDGSLTDIKVIKGLNKEADEEAMRVLKASPKWKPGSQLGIVTRTAYTLPINF